MSDISKEELKKEVAAILKDADLGSTSSKKVRLEIEEKLDVDLTSRKKEIDDLVIEYIDNDKGKSKKNGNVDDDDDEDDEDNEDEEEEEEEEEEEKKPKRSGTKKAVKHKADSSDESEDASEDGDDEYSPKKKSAKKGATKRGRKKKGGSDDDSDEDWGKGKKRKGGSAKKAAPAKRGGGGGGYTKPVSLSPELAALVGENMMPRHEVVKRIWAVIKERNLQDPKNKQFAICDDDLFKVIGVKRFRTFGMMKFLKNHFRD